MPASLTLYQSNGSPNSRRVRLYLAEKQIALTVVPVDLGAKEKFTDAYRAINPRLQVPTLVLEDGTAIGEVPAIWRYLEETFPAIPLLGANARDKALIAMWERRVELDGFAPVMEGVRNAVAGLKGRALSGPHAYAQIPDLVERSKLRVSHFYADLETRLREVPFIAGEEFSIADITGLVTVDFATKGFSLPIPDGHDAVTRWYGMVSSRPSASA